MSLPASVNYAEPMATLPENTQSFSVVSTSLNGSVFGPSSQIIVDLGNRGFLDPASLYFRYKVTWTSPGVTSIANARIVGTPAYTPILRVDTLVNSQTIETINNYNTVANIHTNLALSVADKLGQQYSLGYGLLSADGLANEDTDGSSFVTAASGGGSTTFTRAYSAPLISMLGFSDKLLPLFLMNNTRFVFTLDTAGNCGLQTATATDALISNFSITNFEVVYNCVDMGPAVERDVASMNPKIRIKTSSYASGIAPQIPASSSGSTSLSFNMRYASVKAVILACAGAGANSANRLMDALDVTAGNGDYQFVIGGINYPQRSLSTLNNKAGLMMELRRVMGTIFGNTVAMAITADEFNASTLAATSYNKPGKFWVGSCLQKLTVASRSFFTGVSTQLSPIQVNINLGYSNNQVVTPVLVLWYDAVIELDSVTHQILMIQ